MKKRKWLFISAISVMASFVTGCGQNTVSAVSETVLELSEDTSAASSDIIEKTVTTVEMDAPDAFDLSQVPEYTTSPYIVVNNNVPYFSDADLTTDSFEYYSALDAADRCGVAYASVGVDLMPTEKRLGRWKILIQSLSSYWTSTDRRKCQ